RSAADASEHTAAHSGSGSQVGAAGREFGANQWRVDELYQRYLADPSSVAMEWWNFFADYKPPAGSSAQPASAAPQQGRPAPAPAAPPATAPASHAPPTPGPAPSGGPAPPGAGPAAPPPPTPPT